MGRNSQSFTSVTDALQKYLLATVPGPDLQLVWISIASVTMEICWCTPGEKPALAHCGVNHRQPYCLGLILRFFTLFFLLDNSIDFIQLHWNIRCKEVTLARNLLWKEVFHLYVAGEPKDGSYLCRRQICLQISCLVNTSMTVLQGKHGDGLAKPWCVQPVCTAVKVIFWPLLRCLGSSCSPSLPLWVLGTLS